MKSGGAFKLLCGWELFFFFLVLRLELRAFVLSYTSSPFKEFLILQQGLSHPGWAQTLHLRVLGLQVCTTCPVAGSITTSGEERSLAPLCTFCLLLPKSSAQTSFVQPGFPVQLSAETVPPNPCYNNPKAASKKASEQVRLSETTKPLGKCGPVTLLGQLLSQQECGPRGTLQGLRAGWTRGDGVQRGAGGLVTALYFTKPSGSDSC